MVKSAIYLCLIFSALPAFAQRVQAELACKPAKTDFIYDCTIKLARNGQPLAGAAITVGADMPSMPMAHNVKPAKAKPGKVPGDYEAQLDLEMLGEWAVKLRLSGPVKDQLILHYNFDEKGAKPVIRSGRPLRK
ncbi:MAG: FixH family protein [Pseudomonadota bacterium]